MTSKSDSQSSAESISVCIRMRPLNAREIKNNEKAVWRVLPQMNAIQMTDGSGKPLAGNSNVFQYDHVFGEEHSTYDVYQKSAKRIVCSVVEGFNGTIFAYGQTSSGKTFTMQGSEASPGILQLASEEIFSKIEAATDRSFLLRVSYLEIYNEVIRDLLAPEPKTLKIREDPRRGVYVESHEEIITDFEKITQLLKLGEQRRTVGETAMNERSSRSHTIFKIVVESKENIDERRQSEGLDGAVLVGSLSLVDLAGSESARHTAAEGLRQREASNINKSLLTLSRVILGLSQQGGQAAPFRDSKLTRILQPSLAGNTRTAMICCATMSDRHAEETKMTLQFAARAKNISTVVAVNEVMDDEAQLKCMKRELHALRKLLQEKETQDDIVNLQAEKEQLKEEKEALERARQEHAQKISRLTSLIMNECIDETKPRRQLRKAKRHRETWCPGEISSAALQLGLQRLVEEDEEDDKLVSRMSIASASAFTRQFASPSLQRIQKRSKSNGSFEKKRALENVDPNTNSSAEATEDLKERLRTLQETINAQERDQEERERELAATRQELEKALGALDEASGLQLSLQGLQEENEKLKEALAESSGSASAYLNQVSAVEVEETPQEIQKRYEQELAKAQERLLESLSTIETLQRQAEQTPNASEDNHIVQKEIADLRSELKEKGQLLDQTTAELEDWKLIGSSDHDRAQALEAEVESLKQKLLEFEEQELHADSGQEELSKLRDLLVQSDEMRADLEIKLEEVSAKLQEQLHKVEQQSAVVDEQSRALGALESEASKAKEQISLLESQITNLTEEKDFEILELKQKLDSAERDNADPRTDMDATVMALKCQLESIVDVKVHLEATINERDLELSSLREQMQRVQEDKTGLEDVISEKENVIEDMKKSLDILTAEKAKLEGITGVLEIEAPNAASVKDALEALRQQKESLAAGMDEANAELTTLKEKLLLEEKKSEELRKIGDGANDEVRRLAKTLTETNATIENLNEKLNVQAADLRESQQLLQERDALLQTLEEKVKTLESDQQSGTCVKAEMEQLTIQLFAAKEELASSLTRNDGLDRQIKELQNEIQHLQASHEEDQSKYDSLSAEMLEVTDELLVKSEELAALEEKVANLSTNNKALQEKVMELTNSEQTNGELAMELELLRSELENARSEVHALKVPKEDDLAAVKEALIEQGFKFGDKSFVQQLLALQMEKEKAQSEAAEARQSIGLLTAERDGLIKKLEEVLESKDRADHEKLNDDNALLEAQKKSNSLLEELREVKLALQSAESRAAEANEKLDAFRVTMHTEVEHHTNQVYLKTQEIEVLTSEREEILSRLRHAEAEVNRQATEASLSCQGDEALKKRYQQLQTRFDLLQSTADKSVSKVQVLEKENKKLVGDLETNTIKLTSELEKVKRDLAALQERADRERLEKERLQGILEQLEYSKDEARRELLTLTERHTELTQKLTQLETAQQDHANRTEALDQYRASIKALEKKLEAAREELVEYKNMYQQLHDECSALRKELDDAQALKDRAQGEQGSGEELEKLKDAVVEKESLLAQAHSELRAVQTRLARSQQTVENMNEELQKQGQAYGLQLQELSAAKDQLQKQLNEKEKMPNLEERIQELENSLEFKTQEIMRINTMLDDANDNIERLQERLEESDSKIREAERLAQQYLEDLEVEKEKEHFASHVAKSKDEELAALTAMLEEQQRLLAENEQLNLALHSADQNKELIEVREALTRAEAELTAAREEIEVLRAKVRISEEEKLRLEQLQQELSAKEDLLEMMSKEHITLQEHLANVTEELDVVRQERASLPEDASTMEMYKTKGQCAELEANLRAALADSQLVQEEKKKLEADVAELIDQQAELERQRLLLEKERAEAVQGIANRQKQTEDLQTSVTSLRQQIHSLTAAISEKEAELDSATFRFRQEIAELNEANAAAESEVRRRVTATKQIEQQLADTKAALHQTKSAFETSEKENIAKIQALKDKHEKLELEIKRTADLLEESRERVKKLEKVRLTEEQVQQLMQMKKERKQYQEENVKLKQQLKDLTKRSGSVPPAVDPDNARLVAEALRKSEEEHDSALALASKVLQIQDGSRPAVSELVASLVRSVQSLQYDRKRIKKELEVLSTNAGPQDEIDNLSQEVDRLQQILKTSNEKNAVLMAELDAMESRVAAASGLQDLVEDLQKQREAQEKQIQLLDSELGKVQSELASSADLSSHKAEELRKRISYLESENLQLHVDNRKLEKALLTAKEQPSAASVENAEILRRQYATKIAKLESELAELKSARAVSSTPMPGAVSYPISVEAKIPSSAPLPPRHPAGGDVVQEKENVNNTLPLNEVSAQEKANYVGKPPRRNPQTRPLIDLDGDEDKPGECNQQ